MSNRDNNFRIARGRGAYGRPNRGGRSTNVYHVIEQLGNKCLEFYGVTASFLLNGEYIIKEEPDFDFFKEPDSIFRFLMRSWTSIRTIISDPTLGVVWVEIMISLSDAGSDLSSMMSS